MKKKVWIMNHYAGNQYFDKGGRHYSFAKYLKKEGYNPVIFCSNARHWNNGFFFDSKELKYIRYAEEIDVPFVFVKSRSYSGNGRQRFLNMIDFCLNVQRVGKNYAKKYGSPDVIIASSVHPLTLIAGIQLAKYFKIKCFSEIRDLWPESIVAYSDRLTRDDWIIKLMYIGEKWIYKKSDHIIMTWPGGYDYIMEKGWDKELPKSKFSYISNGVDLEAFVRNKSESGVEDSDLNDTRHRKFVYCGSIRKANHIEMLVDAAELLKEQDSKRALILVYGGGEKLREIEEDIRKRHLDNIIIKGKVDKSQIPYVLSKCDVSLLHNSSTVLDRFGQSQNKLFEYLAIGKPVLMTYSVGYSIIQDRHCGIELEEQKAENIAAAIEMFCEIGDAEYELYCESAKTVSKEFDFEKLTRQMINLIENI